MYPNIEDSLGVKINRYTVIEVTNRKDRYNHRLVKCKCECGTVKEIQYSYLKNGYIKSCGCLVRERAKVLASNLCVKHNKSGTRLHNIWKNMRQRCSNPKASGYKSYGGRGIKICSEWDNFDNFYEWSYSNGYTDEMTIDRLDSDLDYMPSNCQWITKGENSAKRNKDPRNKGFSKSRYSKEDIEKAQRLRLEGRTYSSIGSELGCSISQAKRMCDNEIKYTR